MWKRFKNWLDDKYDERYRRKQNKKSGFASCTCQSLKCICPCLSGGIDADGNVGRNVCLNNLCKEHGEDCIVHI